MNVLLVNVYFWPEAVGGATRVVMDQAEELSSQGHDITILCTAQHSNQDYSIEIYSWEMCRVVRLHVPLKPWEQIRDMGVETFMLNWLPKEMFDCVYFHAIQILTADVVEVCQDLSIETTIFLHDAWWLGRHLFLTSSTGRSIKPGDWFDDLNLASSALNILPDPSSEEFNSLTEILNKLWQIHSRGRKEAKSLSREINKRELQIQVKNNDLVDLVNTFKQGEKKRTDEVSELNISLTRLIGNERLRILVYDAFIRRYDLKYILLLAKNRFAVSYSFAELYTKADIPLVDVKENSSQAVQQIERIRLEDEHGIVFGFIGGWSIHKGVFILEKACRAYRGPAATLLAVNGNLTVHTDVSYNWGSIKVKFIAPVDMTEIKHLYARFDVLLAPSIWPESFGLVTREALSAGKWVICSQAGALADCIETGINGEIVTPTDYMALASAMERCTMKDSN